jgi:hypothetical protein
MNLKVFTPVTVGESATCRVSGDNEPGYIKVKVNGNYARVLPDEHPGVPGQHRLVFAPPSGEGFDVWTDPPWQKGDALAFELYDSNDGLADSVLTTVMA